MPTAMNADEGYFMGIKLLQFLTMPDGYQPVACSVDDVGMTVHFPDPVVGTEVVPEKEAMGQKRQEPFYCFYKTKVRRIQYQVAGCIICSYLGGKSAAQASPVNKYMVLFIFFGKSVVYKLHISQHFFLTPLTGAFSKATVIYQYYIIAIPVKIPCIFCPAFNAPGIAVKI